MSAPTDFVRTNAEAIREIAASHGAVNVRLFGSRLRGDHRPESDLDLLVDFEAGRSLFDLIDLKQELEERLGCAVDIVTERALNPHISEHVLAEAVPL
jgi:predicted nucleotidyltransferase